MIAPPYAYACPRSISSAVAFGYLFWIAGFRSDSHTASMIAWCDITEYPSVLGGFNPSSNAASKKARARFIVSLYPISSRASMQIKLYGRRNSILPQHSDHAPLNLHIGSRLDNRTHLGIRRLQTNLPRTFAIKPLQRRFFV